MATQAITKSRVTQGWVVQSGIRSAVASSAGGAVAGTSLVGASETSSGGLTTCSSVIDAFPPNGPESSVQRFSEALLMGRGSTGFVFVRHPEARCGVDES